MFLLHGRQYSCAMLSHIYSNLVHRNTMSNSSPIPEAARCWLRTALAWDHLSTTITDTTEATIHEYTINQIKYSYHAAIQYHEATGGTSALSRSLVGIELENHMQVVMDCILGYTRILWKEMVHNSNTKASSSVTGDTSKRELQRLLIQDAILLINYLPHERTSLIKIMMDIGQSYLDYRKFNDAELWLQATLKLMDINNGSTITSTAEEPVTIKMDELDIIKSHLLLSLATCTVEQLIVAKLEGRLIEYDDTSSSNISPQTSVSLPSSIGKITGYLGASRGEHTVIGQHILVKVTCLQGRADEAQKHLQELIQLSSKEANNNRPRIPLFRTNNTVPSSTEDLHVHPDFHLITSALRTFAGMRNFDLIAMKEYGNVATTCFPQSPEIGLLRHDLLVSLLISLSNTKDNMNIDDQPQEISIPSLPFKALQDPRVEWTLQRIIDDSNNSNGPLIPFVYESIVKILQDGIESAYEAKQWSICESLLDRMYSLVMNPNNRQACLPNNQLSQLCRTKAMVLLELGKYTDALTAVEDSIKYNNTVAGAFLRLRIVVKLMDTNNAHTVDAPNLEQVFQALSMAPDFQSIHLIAAIEELATVNPSTIQSKQKLMMAQTAINNLFQSIPEGDTTSYHPKLRTIPKVRLATEIHQKLYQENAYSDTNLQYVIELFIKVSEHIHRCQASTDTSKTKFVSLVTTTTGAVPDFIWCIQTIWNIAMSTWMSKHYTLSCIAAGMLIQFATTLQDIIQCTDEGNNNAEHKSLLIVIIATGHMLQVFNHLLLATTSNTSSEPLRPAIANSASSVCSIIRYTSSEHLHHANEYIGKCNKEYKQDVDVSNTSSPLWKLIGSFINHVALQYYIPVRNTQSFTDAWGTLPTIIAIMSIQARLLLDPSTSSTIQTSLLPSLNKMITNPFVFDNLSEIFRQPPHSNRGLAYHTLRLSKDMAIADFNSSTPDNKITIEYIASRFRKLLLLVSSRSESLPLFDEIYQFLSTISSSSSSASVMFPIEELDFMGVLAWNHGCFFYRMNVLERAERFMHWTIQILPFVQQFESTNKSCPVNTAITCISNASAMRQQYDHICQSLGKQVKITIPVPIVLDTLISTTTSLLNRVTTSTMETVSNTIESSTLSDDTSMNDIPPLESSLSDIEEVRNKRAYSPPSTKDDKSGFTPVGKKRLMESNTNDTENNLIPKVVSKSINNTITESTLLISDPLDDQDVSFTELCRLDNELPLQHPAEDEI